MIVSDTRGTTHLAKQIRTLREAKGMSRAFFAKSLGVTKARAAKFEDPAFDGWTGPVLRNIARVLDMHLDARFIAPAWDCYSPVALVLWRAADFAEVGEPDPLFRAFYETPGGPPHELNDALGDVCWTVFGNPLVTCHVGKTGIVCGLRQWAEFGPAGRPR